MQFIKYFFVTSECLCNLSLHASVQKHNTFSVNIVIIEITPFMFNQTFDLLPNHQHLPILLFACMCYIVIELYKHSILSMQNKKGNYILSLQPSVS